MNRPLICFSLTRDEHAKLSGDGPRRDIPLLAERCNGELLFRRAASRRGGLRATVCGPHIRHAWEAAGHARRGGVVFADGEHVGFPLAAFLALRLKRNVRLVILGHFVDRGWKKRLLRLATRFVSRGALVLHSKSQADAVASLLPAGWDLHLLPYQVDTDYWQLSADPTERPLVVSAGSENRDYETLITAAEGLEVDVCIASGSHWAREKASAGTLPANVRFITETLPFAQLRDLYARSAVIAIPLRPVSNQSGITTILEAMSMGKPVIVSATPGQQEAITGPIVTPSGEEVDSGRGPQILGLAKDSQPTGIYVVPGDPTALRIALQRVLADSDRAASVGAAARASAMANFSIELFADRFARLLNEVPEPRSHGEPVAAS